MVMHSAAIDPVNAEIPSLIISPRQETHSVLGVSLYSVKGGVRQAHTCHDACEILRQHTVAVVLAETDLPDGGWRDLQVLLSSDPSHPKLIVLLESGQEDYRNVWVAQGAFDAISISAAPAALVGAVAAAYIAWHRDRWMTLAARASRTAAFAAGVSIQ